MLRLKNRYFCILGPTPINLQMDNKKEIELLKRAGCPDSVIEHILAVTNTALRIANEVRIPVDKEIIRSGALLHDIGRSKTHGINHAVVGAEIGRSFGVDERIVRIIERHIGAGITGDEAAALGLPVKEYLPETPEEKIVAYADNLINGTVEVPFDKALEQFKNALGEDHPAIWRHIRLHEEIEEWKGCESDS